ncbi:multidrug efflux system protein MdtJ [compost metagenome]
MSVMALGSLLLILSAVLHAAWNALAKGSRDKESLIFLMTALSGVFTLALILILDGGFKAVAPMAFVFAILSGIFEGLYLGSLSNALKDAALGQAYAIMRGGAMVFVWLVSTLFLREQAQLIQYLGALLIFAGLMVLNVRGGKPAQEKRSHNIGAYLCAFFISGYHICYHQALVLDADPKSLFLISMVVSLPFLIWGLGRDFKSRVTKAWSEQRGRALLTGFFSTASFLIFLYGLQVSAPGYAISLRNSSIFFAIVFSFFLKESLTRVQIVGAGVIGIGTILLSL